MNSQGSRRGDREAYCATLEMLCCGNATVGSNPTFSAIFFADVAESVDATDLKSVARRACGFKSHHPH